MITALSLQTWLQRLSLLICWVESLHSCDLKHGWHNVSNHCEIITVAYREGIAGASADIPKDYTQAPW